MKRIAILLAVVLITLLTVWHLSAAPKTMFVGDSITYLWDVQAPKLGVKGDTSADLLYNIKQQTSFPDNVYVLIGINDIVLDVPMDYYQGNVINIGHAIEREGGKPIICSVLPVGDKFSQYDQKIIDMNSWLKSYAAERGWQYVNYYDEMVLPYSHRLNSDYSDDGIHPNAMGYTIMQRVIMPPQ